MTGGTRGFFAFAPVSACAAPLESGRGNVMPQPPFGGSRRAVHASIAVQEACGCPTPEAPKHRGGKLDNTTPGPGTR